ncbi:MAG TPA: MFS transporter [Acidimicrobiia bacterium]|nr:MFS transporter [Acidimicrobiia bacterium]
MTATSRIDLRRVGFTVSLVAAMAAATSLPPTLGLLGTELIAQFEITRGQLGLIIGMSMLVGGLSSPVVGVFTDWLGGQRALALVFAISGVSYLALSAAPAYWFLLVAAFIGGIANGLTNPATNKLIATDVAPGRRGIVTGIKQSGVQVGATLLGLLVPLGVIAWGWRPTVSTVGLVWLAFLGIIWKVTSPADANHRPSRVGRTSAFGQVWQVSVYGLTLGMVAAVIILLPLLTEEALGFSRVTAGRVTALAAVTAIAGRLAWARRAERLHAYPGTLRLIAWLAVAALAIIAGSFTFNWLIWLGAVVIGLSAGSWNSVGMLATIVTAGPSRAGAATGWVQLGFLAGAGLSAPLYGWLIDITGSYQPVLAVAGAAAVVGSIVIGRGFEVVRP